MSEQLDSPTSSAATTPRASTSQQPPRASSPPSRASTASPPTPATSSGTSIEDSVLEFLEELDEVDELELDEEEMFDDEEDDGRGLDGPTPDVNEPLMSRGRSRRRRRWAEDGRIGDRSLLEVRSMSAGLTSARPAITPGAPSSSSTLVAPAYLLIPSRRCRSVHSYLRHIGRSLRVCSYRDCVPGMVSESAQLRGSSCLHIGEAGWIFLWQTCYSHCRSWTECRLAQRCASSHPS